MQEPESQKANQKPPPALAPAILLVESVCIPLNPLSKMPTMAAHLMTRRTFT
jgi:hypothetical protein